MRLFPRDMLPLDIADELAKLQDRVPPFSGKTARAFAEKAYGMPMEEVFSTFDETPLAAASIAQVHRARLKSGEDVIIKLLRPGGTFVSSTTCLGDWPWK